jgi:hypothetical protein
MKGFNLWAGIDPGTAQNYISEAYQLGANTIRYQLGTDSEDNWLNRVKFVNWRNEALENFRIIAEGTAQSFPGVRFIIDLHSPFGAANEQGQRCLTSSVYFNFWIEDLLAIAQKIANLQNVYIFEPINEPMISAQKWRPIAKKLIDLMPRFTGKKIAIPAAGVGPSSIAMMPKIKGSQFLVTTHFWPQMSLLKVPALGDKDPTGRELVRIEKGGYLSPLQYCLEYRRKNKTPVYIGEIGCTKGIGLETQKEYMSKTLSFCLRNGLSAIVHPFEHGQIWDYDSGVFDVVQDVFN